MPRVLSISQLNGDGLIHGFSTLDLGTVGMTHAPDPDAVRASRRAFAQQLGVDPSTLTVAGAVHGTDIARVDRPQDLVQDVDGLMTDRKNVSLFATYADCYPIVLWDPTHHAVALIHAGWRGTEAGVASAAVRAMKTEFSSRPEDLRAGIGPGICGTCYEVGVEVAQRFDQRFVNPSGDSYLLDLAAALRSQLEGEGLTQIYTLGLCTKESDFLPSHRRAADGMRFGAIVAIR